jgi:Cys-tRNA(Pro)/Cys-tRNA(Cys) deacylase
MRSGAAARRGERWQHARVPKGAATPALAAIRHARVEHRVHRFDHDPANTTYGPEAATALGVELARVLKTLVASVDGALAVAVIPVSRQLDLRRFAASQGAKRATMAEPRHAERATGYVVGGISPFGQKTTLPTVVDESAMGFATVFVSAGRRGLEIELTPEDLVRVTNATTAPIARAQ